MNNRFIWLLVSFGILISSASLVNAAEHVTSPDGRISVTIGLKSGKPYYTVNYQNTPIIVPSHLGFLLDKGDVSRFHQLDCDEIWYYHAGCGMKIVILQNGQPKEVLLGIDTAK